MVTMQKGKREAEHERKIPGTPLRFLWYVSRGHAKYIIGVLFAVLVSELLGTGIPYIFKSIIDTAQLVAAGSAPITNVWLWAGAYVLASAIIFAGWRVSGFLGMEWASRLNATAYTTLFSYLTRHSHEYFSDRFAGSLSSKVGHASEGVGNVAEQFMWNYYPTVLSLVFTTVFIFSSSTMAGVVFVVLVAVLVPLNIFLVRTRHPHVVKYSEQTTKARGYAVDAITNMALIRQFSRMQSEEKRFGEHIGKMRFLNVKQWRMSEWSLILNNVTIVVFDAAILYIAVRSWTQEVLTIGELVMIVTLLMNIQHALTFIGMSMNRFIRLYGEIQEGLSDIIVEHDIVDSAHAKRLVCEKGYIEWQDVFFSYKEQKVFANVNIKIEAGERVGLVGTSGAGKTTFVSLLLRQHELDSGSIRIDGQDIREVTQDSLRENIAIVSQEPMLFHRTIAENISYGKPNATSGEIVAVAKKAQAHEFVEVLPHRYDTLVGERGVKLSGGQKQRIAIARAMLKNAPILILDEATSALDSESEVAIQKALHALMAGKTVIAIAHRLSTLREMDRIIVLDAGKIIEDGSHEELVKKNGTYARLWEHQAGGFLPS